jgi:hypothetical protein
LVCLKSSRVIDLTEYSCADHFSKDIQADQRRDSLYQLLKDVRVFQASDISTTYIVNAQGIERKVRTNSLMRLDVEENQLRVFVPRNKNGQKDAFATCLAKEMICFLGLPETKSWWIITAVLTLEPKSLDSFLIDNASRTTTVPPPRIRIRRRSLFL